MQEEQKLEIYEDVLVNADRSSVMMVCINGHRGVQPYGDIVNCHLAKLICFQGFHELILAIDEVCERVGAPMRTTEPRFINSSSAAAYEKLSQKRDKTDLLNKRKAVDRIIPFVANAKEVIVVEVLYRQNASLQGRLQCRSTGSKYITFRSALELLRMLEDIDETCIQSKERK